LWETFHSRRTKIIDLNQRQNKESRILTEATFVQRNILFPSDWAERWPRFFEAMVNYMRKGKNEHDDAPDTVTGLAEYIQHGAERRRKFYSGKGARK
ncbi:MAG: phage terminase large subunit, partial [Clostridia bacterium]